MKRKYNIKHFVYILLPLLLLIAFASEEEETENYATAESSYSNTIEKEKPILVYTKYDLPLPVDFYRFLKKQDFSDNDFSHLNSIQNIEKYISNKKRGVNFGIYTSDLAYCTVFERTQHCIDYFSVTKELADALHISKGYNMEMIERLDDNINNNDSLHKIASKAYWNACNFLEANDEVNILPLIIAGGWIESIYLAVISVDEKNPPTEFLERLSSEKESLKNLIQYLLDVIMDSNTFEINSDIQELGTKFKVIREIYNDIPEGENLTKEQFIQLKVEITKIRDFYVE